MIRTGPAQVAFVVRSAREFLARQLTQANWGTVQTLGDAEITRPAIADIIGRDLLLGSYGKNHSS